MLWSDPHLEDFVEMFLYCRKLSVVEKMVVEIEKKALVRKCRKSPFPHLPGLSAKERATHGRAVFKAL